MDRVELYISREPYLIDEGIEEQDLPRPLLDLVEAGLVAIRTIPNIGPIRKFVAPLKRAIESGERESTLVLCADDDYLFPPHFVSTYYRYHATMMAAWALGQIGEE